MKMEPNSSRRFAFALLFLACWVAAEGAEHLKYRDPKQPLYVRIEDLLSRMTLTEKIGQMAQIERKNASSEVIKNYFIGSVLSEGGSAPAPKASAKVWVDMVNQIQRAALSSEEFLGAAKIGAALRTEQSHPSKNALHSSQNGIFLFVRLDLADIVHGHGTVYKATIFPHNIGLGATRDPSLVKKIGAATALEVRATGIPYTFAPCIAVCRDPRWGRCYESYSEDSKLVQEMTEIIPGLQGDIPKNSLKGVPFVGGKTKIAACAKHYVGDGGTRLGINENNTITNFHGLLSIHMPPYYNAIIKGVSSVMVSYSSWNEVKMHANHYLLIDFLKNKLRFRGFIISDYQGIDRITTPAGINYTLSLQKGILAGIDMIMIPYDYVLFFDSFLELVHKNVIPMSRIDDAVRRILRVKFTMGLFENPFGDYSLANEIGKQEHRDLAREAVRKSLVLLKNGKIHGEPILPLSKKAKKILIVGSNADNLGYQCGGWTIEWQGLSGNDHTTGTTLLAAIKETVDPNTEVVYSENPNTYLIKSHEFSYAIVAVGEHSYAETVGDSLNLTIAEPGTRTIRNVCEQIKCVVVLLSGRPVVIEPYIHMIDGLVAAWFPGIEGRGMTDVLFGNYGFTGKLSRTWFKSVDQLPMNVGDAHYDPLYSFGFGLTTEPVKAGN